MFSDMHLRFLDRLHRPKLRVLPLSYTPATVCHRSYISSIRNLDMSHSDVGPLCQLAALSGVSRITPETEPMTSILSKGAKPLTRTAFEDLRDGLCNWELWGRLAFLDVKRRYRRTTLGPFWSTASLAISIALMGTVGGGLLKRDMSVYLPFLASGMVVWMMISSILNESGARSSLPQHHLSVRRVSIIRSLPIHLFGAALLCFCTMLAFISWLLFSLLLECCLDQLSCSSFPVSSLSWQPAHGLPSFLERCVRDSGMCDNFSPTSFKSPSSSPRFSGRRTCCRA